MTYNTCQTYFLNQDASSITYCRTEWVRIILRSSSMVGLLKREDHRAWIDQSKLVTWLASDCSAANNAHGGLCVATDQRWYVQ